jgi:hypothetical protein
MTLVEIGYDKNQQPAAVNKVMNLSVLTKTGEFLDKLSDHQLLQKESVPWSYLIDK